ncbi:hypothetical protein BDV93DRAFT_494255 [Ceratobasidium sp. AG-I]|nr:hypothetical protein BDV93DRAFT_494255 [Ceratobasidium sp. AG-I]
MLVISNPNSGYKTGPQFIYNFVIPLLNKHNVAFTLQSTNAPGHAGELAKEYLNTLSNAKSAVVLVSGGDGTIHEVINALYADLTSSDPKPPTWPELQLILVNSGTANALYYSIYPLVAGPNVLRFVNETLPGADIDAASRLQSVVAYLTQAGSTRPLALARNTVFKQDGSTKQSLLSVVVASTALHANLLHTSEDLRATMPGVERYTEAAKLNLDKWSHAKARLTSSSKDLPVSIYDPSLDKFVECSSDQLDGPFAYFLSTLNVDRLESGFVIAPLASKIKPGPHTIDVVVIRPLRSPQVKGDTAEARQQFARTLMGSMGAARSATHTHIRYPKDPNSETNVSGDEDGPLLIEYYRCSGWEWAPENGSRDASYVCVDGTILELEEGDWAKSECITGLLPNGHGVKVFV